ncbi:MAG: hypothetical protein ACXWX4_08530 [Actinomycetota bacterium]
MSARATPHPDPELAARGLPDFTALLATELATAAAPPNRHALSSLGVGELVLSARELSGSSQRALAARAGTSQAAVPNASDGLADYVPMRTPSPFEGPRTVSSPTRDAP